MFSLCFFFRQLRKSQVLEDQFKHIGLVSAFFRKLRDFVLFWNISLLFLFDRRR